MSGVTLATMIISMVFRDWYLRLGEKEFRRFSCEVRSGRPLVDNVPFADSSAGADPLVIGIHELFQISVTEDARGNIAGYTRNFGGDATRHDAP